MTIHVHVYICCGATVVKGGALCITGRYMLTAEVNSLTYLMYFATAMGGEVMMADTTLKRGPHITLQQHSTFSPSVLMVLILHLT